MENKKRSDMEECVIKYKDNFYLRTEVGYKKIILTTDQDLIKDGVQAIDDEFLEWFVNNPSCEEVEVDRIELNTDYRSDWKQKFRHKIIIPKEEPKQETTLKEFLLQLRNTPMTFVPKEEQKQHLIDMMKGDEELGLYEEPKQETLEEAVNKFKKTDVYINEIKQETLEEVIKREYEARKFNSDFPFDPQSFKLGAKWQAKRRYTEEEVKSAYAEGGFAIMRYLEGKECLDVDKWFEQFFKLKNG